MMVCLLPSPETSNWQISIAKSARHSQAQAHRQQYPNKSLTFNALRHYLLPNQRSFQQNSQFGADFAPQINQFRTEKTRLSSPFKLSLHAKPHLVGVGSPGLHTLQADFYAIQSALRVSLSRS
jgi:hypothetical protein